MHQLIQISTTTADRREAEKIAAALLEARLAACVQISRIRSSYRWQGKIERDDEFLCTIKSRTDLFERVEEMILSLHSYEVPEIIGVPLTVCSGKYEQWLAGELLHAG